MCPHAREETNASLALALTRLPGCAAPPRRTVALSAACLPIVKQPLKSKAPAVIWKALNSFSSKPRTCPMTQTSNRIFDDLAKMMTDAAGAAEGMKKEVESVMKAQAERFINSMDVVKREEFEVVKAMAQKAREENEALKARLAELEARLSSR
jgi:BMFP domain-containing protein YqiC